jgi:predicted DCC family thiol-disulfide oxidoreductase YuxK
MNTFWRRFHDFWFEPAPATRLALLRICVGAFVTWFLWDNRDTYLKVAQLSPQLFAPVGVVFHGPVALDLFRWAFDATFLLAIVFTFGLWHRITGPLFAGLFLWLVCYRQSWSMIYHSDNMVVMHVIVLAVTRAADALSLDAFLRKRREPGVVPEERVGWEYNWPVRLMCALVVSAYFVTAVAKLSGPMGLEWMTGHNLRAQMAVDAMRKELLGGRPNPVSHALYDMVWLFSALAKGSLCVEFFAPLALLHRRAGWFWAVNTFFMHWGILLVMHITFHYQLSGVMFLAFFPVERVLVLWHRLERALDVQGRLAAPVGGPAPIGGVEAHGAAEPTVSRAGVRHPVLYYDGECGLCDRFVQFVLKHDPSERFQFATLQSLAGRQQLARLKLSDTDLQTMVMVDADASYTRSTAALRICRQLQAPWPLLYTLMAIPRPVRDGVYSFIAARRKLWFRPPPECPVMSPELRRRFLS